MGRHAELAMRAKELRAGIRNLALELMKEGIFGTHKEMISAENNLKTVQWDLEAKGEAERKKVSR